MSAYVDLTFELWLRAWRIPIFRKPLVKREVERWIAGLAPGAKNA